MTGGPFVPPSQRSAQAAATQAADSDAFAATLLDLRASRLAANRLDQDDLPVGTNVLCFGIGGETYALPLADLIETMPLGSWTPVPGVSQHLLGVVNLRGEIRPVLNLHAMLGLPEPAADAPALLLFLRGGGAEIGLRTETLDRIRLIDERTLTLPHQSGNGLPQRFIAGISPDTVILLDARQILTVEPLRDHRATNSAGFGPT